MFDSFIRFIGGLMILHALILMQIVQASSLKDHPSPYLGLHANDPVKWQSWSPSILQQAQADNKLIYLSIGYFSCHWCHVMQKESYQDEQVGQFLNQHYVTVKVDRELRPELDRRMLRFVEAVRGQAGWPLNVFLTPSGYPITGFIYLPRDNFYEVIKQLDQQWQSKHEEIKQLARDYFLQTESNEARSELLKLPDEHFDKVIQAFVSQAMLLADELQGGFGETSKFPSYPQLNSLLDIINTEPGIDTDVIDFVQLTLKIMSERHLMDHVNGGFFRYVTDPDWQTPHFEKMLYDNAQLAQLYFKAASLWPKQGYAEIGKQTIRFMLDFLADATGGFNASLSAVDKDNVEGAAYYWSIAELKKALSEKEFKQLAKQWGLPEDPEHRLLIKPLENLSHQEGNGVLSTIKLKLRNYPKPEMPVDHKKLASWNALALKALLSAESFDEDKMLKTQTDQLYDYMVEHFIGAGQVIRFSGHASSADTTLMDYAQMAHAFQLYALDRAYPEAAKLAQDLTTRALELYLQADRWVQQNNSLIPGDQGEWVIQDSVLESPVSLLLETIYLMPDPALNLVNQARKLITRLTRDMLDVPYHYGSAIMIRQKYHQTDQVSLKKPLIH
ncbi:MAG: DUF255 domain-containing protein [Gammaproteobacteria bacterium]|nr:DUF255 domain-containing protein [Gammaproteobacteria bacterium]